MSDHDHYSRSINDRNRDGVNDDFDGRPGSNSNSASYDRIYNPDGYSELGLGGDQASRLRNAAEEAEVQQYYQDQRENQTAQSRVHFWPSVGKFIIPRAEENTWAGHAALVEDTRTAIYFNPEKYLFFDKIIAERFPAVLNPENEQLRVNLAVMRNDIIGIYLRDGSFDPGDEKYVPCIKAIAGCLGDALAGDTWWKRPFTGSIDVRVASAEAVGAAEMYKYLLRQQAAHGPFQNLIANIRQLLGLEERLWDLPPLEQTPFSAKNLAAPALPADQCLSKTEMEQLQKATSRGKSFAECCLTDSTSRQLAI